MRPRFDWSQDTLRCANCLEPNGLHNYEVEVFQRTEDALDGLHVHVDIRTGAARIDTSLKGNPSSRRHGVTLRFWCELCRHISKLTIAQHKGAEMVVIVDEGPLPSGFWGGS